MPSQQQRSDTTRAALLAAFRASLLEQGLEATTTAGVLAATGLSKGALYHHFASKAAIIAAIYRAESHGAIDRALEGCAQDAGPLARLKQACSGWLAEIRDPAVGAILFRLGPAALGPEEAKRIEEEYSLRLFEQLLAEAQAAGEIGAVSIPLAARLLNAVMAELALTRALSPAAVTERVAGVIDGVLRGLENPREDLRPRAPTATSPAT